MRSLINALAVALLALGMAGCYPTDDQEPPPKPLEKKVDELNRKVEEIQSLLAELKESRKKPAPTATSEALLYWQKNPPIGVPPPLPSVSAFPKTKPTAERIPIVSSRSLRLTYDLVDVGKSEVARIEVWATQDTLVWRKLVEQAPSHPPVIQAQVEKEGRWGFRLIALSSIGRGEPAPERGHQPDFWVEVDETKPSVIMYAPEVTGEPDRGQMTIRWTADDRHLAERPISIAYSTDGQLWKTLATGLANDGRHVWNIPPSLPQAQCYVRIEAVDQAGNVGSVQTPSPIITDLAIPKAKIKGVEMPSPSTFAPTSVASGLSSPSPIVPVTAIEPAPPSIQPSSFPGGPVQTGAPSPVSPSNR